jgi:hypothetical protein
MNNHNLMLASISIGPWQMVSVTFQNSAELWTVPVFGIIGNSVTTSSTGKQRLAKWKTQVATTIQQRRGPTRWASAWHYALSVGFSFYPQNHGNQSLDIENFLKPIFDALAAGLFCDASADLTMLQRYNYDDSNFRHLFIYRLPDALTCCEEGAAFCISVRKQDRDSA